MISLQRKSQQKSVYKYEDVAYYDNAKYQNLSTKYYKIRKFNKARQTEHALWSNAKTHSNKCIVC